MLSLSLDELMADLVNIVHLTAYTECAGAITSPNLSPARQPFAIVPCILCHYTRTPPNVYFGEWKKRIRIAPSLRPCPICPPACQTPFETKEDEGCCQKNGERGMWSEDAEAAAVVERPNAKTVLSDWDCLIK